MLPSSHSVLIAEAPEFLEFEERGVSADSVTQKFSALSPKGGMQTVLAGAFADFMNASDRLEQSYRELQEEVSILRQELSKRNAALEQSRNQNRRMRFDLERIVESMPCGVIVAQSDGAVVLINDEGTRLLDVTPAGGPRTLGELSAMLGIERWEFSHVQAGSDLVREVHLSEAKQERWIEVRSQVYFEDEQAQRQILILRDVTARKLAEGKREEGRRAMAMAEVAADMAHEIRNPLGSLELFAELIEEDDVQRTFWISNLRAGLRSLSAIVNNVLMMQSGQLQLVALDLPDALESALTFASPVAEQAEIKLEWRREVESFPIRGNVCALQQIVLNVVMNAIRHTPAKGSLVVTVSAKTADSCTVEFLDSGEGFPAEALDKVLEAGFSGSGSTSGRGLAVCRQIMSEHGGSIQVDNGPKGGARIRLNFPRRQEVSR